MSDRMGGCRRRLNRWALSAFLVALYCFFVAAGPRLVIADAPDGPKYRTAYACEGSTLNMDCDRGHVINLIRANYGRFSITICNEHGNTEWSVNCMSLRSHRVLHDKCSQRQNCSVPASTRGFGDPCPGTLKYLEAHFQCVPVHPPSQTARPRPPWFLSTKTTVIPPFLGDPNSVQPKLPPPPAGFSLDQDKFRLQGTDPQAPPDFDTLSSPTSSTTTLRPPPWLITSSSKNTTTASTSTTTSSTTTSSSSTQATSSQRPKSTSSNSVTSKNLPPSEGDSIVTTSPSVDSPDESEKQNDANKMPENTKKQIYGKHHSSTTSTTSWSPLSDAPGTREGEEISWCPPSSGRGLFWNWTRSGDVAVLPCPGGASGWATRSCASEGWSSPPDLGECRSVWLTTLLSRTEAQDAVLAIAQDLSQVTELRKLYGGDLTAAGRLLTKLTQRMGQDMSNFPDAAQLEALVTELLVNALTTVSNIFVRQLPAWGDLRPSEHRRAITQLLLGLEEAAFFLADNIRHEKIITHTVPSILMRLQVIETRKVTPISFPSAEDSLPSELQPTPHFRSRTNAEDHFTLSSTTAPESAGTGDYHRDEIVLPPEALLENSENGLVKIVFFSYNSLQDLLQPDKNFRNPFDEIEVEGGSQVVNSRVLSASLGAGRHIELSEPVYVTFALTRTVNVSNPSCVFWDYTTSAWSEEGCLVHRFNRSHVTCRCEHLTNFAVLMDVHAVPLAPAHRTALSIITYVGCVVSIIGLLLATVVFHAFRALKSDRTTIHKNLCLCLLLAEALFVGGVSRTDHPLLCAVVAGALHYFFLAAFAWMFFEGFQLYVMLVEVFESEKSRVRWYYLAAYGFPAVVVLISAIVDPQSYGTEAVCWLRTDNYFIFAFVGPVLVVIMANSVFLVLSLVLMCRHANNSAVLKNKETSKLANLRTWVRGAVILMFLLGLTWTFGLLYLNESSVVMAYIFTVLNSLQGLFIFIFHCLQNDKKHSFKSCGRDSGHGGSELEESPRTGIPGKMSSLRLNNNNSGTAHSNGDRPRLVNPFAAAAALEHSSPAPTGILPDYRMAGDISTLRYTAASSLNGHRMNHRNQSPWNHTYTEIAEGIARSRESHQGGDPVYEEIEKEGRRSEVQISDMSDEDGRRQNSDISRQSSRSYGDHRPLLPYTLPDHLGPSTSLSMNDARFQPCLRHPDAVLQMPFSDNRVYHTHQHPQYQHQDVHHHQFDPTIVSAGHMLPFSHPNLHSPHCSSPENGLRSPLGSPQYQDALVSTVGNSTVVQPLSEPNLRNWEAVQRHKDLQHLQHLGEMTVAVLNGEQVVCKLKPPLAPIHENSSQATTTASAPLAPTFSSTGERFLSPIMHSHC